MLIVGAGAAGLECALTLARRGHPVTLAEASKDLGGRVLRESRLPGLAEWIRVRDYRVSQLRKMPGVDIYPASELTAEDVLEFGARRVVCATGAHWRRDGLGRHHLALPLDPSAPGLFTPDDVMDGARIDGPVVIYDDDGTYLAAALAEKLLADGAEVAVVTPHATFARWTALTLEQDRLTRRMLERGVRLETATQLGSFDNENAHCECVHTGRAVTSATPPAVPSKTTAATEGEPLSRGEPACPDRLVPPGTAGSRVKWQCSSRRAQRPDLPVGDGQLRVLAMMGPSPCGEASPDGAVFPHRRVETGQVNHQQAVDPDHREAGPSDCARGLVERSRGLGVDRLEVVQIGPCGGRQRTVDAEVVLDVQRPAGLQEAEHLGEEPQWIVGMSGRFEEERRIEGGVGVRECVVVGDPDADPIREPSGGEEALGGACLHRRDRDRVHERSRHRLGDVRARSAHAASRVEDPGRRREVAFGEYMQDRGPDRIRIETRHDDRLEGVPPVGLVECVGVVVVAARCVRPGAMSHGKLVIPQAQYSI